jgi:replicative DNA helicase
MAKGNNKILDRLPPQNIEAEKSLLGSLLLDREAINKVIDFLRPEDFYGRSHQIIFEHITRLFEKREPIDLLSLSNVLGESGNIETVGGVAYLSSLVNAVPSAAHVAHYGKIIERKKVLRDLINTAHGLIGLGYEEDQDVEVILDQAEQKLFSVSQRSIQQVFTPVSSILHEAFERLDNLHRGDGQLRGAPTGFYDLDNLVAGLQKSDLIILGARPSLGKSTLALDIARNVAKNTDLPVGVFTLEMSKDQVVDRLIAAEAGISLWKLRTGRLSSEGDDNDFGKIQNALDALSNANIFIDDASSPTVLQIRAMSRRLQAEKGLGLIIVDYLQLIQPNRGYDSPVQQITEISRNLKALARELNIPVLALSQLSRSSENRPDQRPKLSDLRDSGSLEQDADLVMFIYREDRVKRESEKKNVAEIIVAKHRNGPTGEVELYFDEERVTFRNLAKNF